MRSADYTRKTQRLAQDKSKSLEDIKDSNPELYNAVVQLREAWVATKDDISETIKEQLEEIESKKSSEQSAKQFFENNPDLEKSQKAILELRNTGMTPAEVAIHYWFADSDKLQKRKKEVKGKFAPKPKSYESYLDKKRTLLLTNLQTFLIILFIGNNIFNLICIWLIM